MSETINKFQARLLANPCNKKEIGNYLFYGVPNDFEGELFMKLFKRFLNPKFKYYRQFRKSGSWSHSVNSTDGDSFVVYVDDKNKKTLADEYIQSNIKLRKKLKMIEDICKADSTYDWDSNLENNPQDEFKEIVNIIKEKGIHSDN